MEAGLKNAIVSLEQVILCAVELRGVRMTCPVEHNMKCAGLLLRIYRREKLSVHSAQGMQCTPQASTSVTGIRADWSINIVVLRTLARVWGRQGDPHERVCEGGMLACAPACERSCCGTVFVSSEIVLKTLGSYEHD